MSSTSSAGPWGTPGNEQLVAAGASAIAQPEAVLDLDAVGPRSAGSASQMALALDLPPTNIELPVDEPVGGPGPSPVDKLASEPEADSGGPTEPRTGPAAIPPGAPLPASTGFCWCGCGKEVEAGAFFLSRHSPGVAQRAVIKHFGSVEQLLVMFGEAPGEAPEPGC